MILPKSPNGTERVHRLGNPGAAGWFVIDSSNVSSVAAFSGRSARAP